MAQSPVTTIKNPLNLFATSCYRVMLNIKRTDRIRNDRILDISVKKYALFYTNNRGKTAEEDQHIHMLNWDNRQLAYQ